jgi:hypothetical protein
MGTGLGQFPSRIVLMRSENMSTVLRQFLSSILVIISGDMGTRFSLSVEDFINNIRKYEHWIQTAFFDDSIHFVRRNGRWASRVSLDFLIISRNMNTE